MTLVDLAIMLFVGIFASGAMLGYVGIYQVSEGHVGVIWRAGALMDSLQGPGLHWKIPFFDKHAEIMITMQTDSVMNIPCGTSGGVLVHFDRIEVVNRLDRSSVLSTMRDYGEHYDKIWIFDKIHHEVNQFCSKHTLQEVYIDKFDTLDEQLQGALQSSCSEYKTGISISAVRVTKPRLPEIILQNYVKIEAERANLRISQERQKVVLSDAETETLKQKLEAARQKAIKEIGMDQQIMEQQKQAEMQAIKSDAEVSRIKALADAEAYRMQQLAGANKLLHTPGYLTELLYKVIGNNTKIYFGDSIPKMFIDPAAVLGLGAGSGASCISDAGR